jgi:two-component system chemotaxis sensor kinase CheA
MLRRSCATAGAPPGGMRMASEPKSTAVSDQLLRAIEHAAALVVATDLSAPDEAARRNLEEAAGAVAAGARQAGGELAQVAELLARSVRQIGEADQPASLDKQLAEQIRMLQELASRQGEAQPRAGQPGSLFSGALAHDPELVTDFLMESREHLECIESQALTLENDPANAEAIHAMFRAFHTMKGLAGFLEFAAVQEVAHEIETLLDLVRQGEMPITPALIDIVLESADYLAAWMSHIEAALGDAAGQAPASHDALCARIRAFAALEEGTPKAESPAELLNLSGSVSAAAMEPSEETGQRATDGFGPDKTGAANQTEDAVRRQASPAPELRAIKVDTAKLDYLVEMVGEMVIAQSLIRHDPDLERLKTPRLLRNITQASRITNEVQKTAMAMRMVPIGQLFQRMTRLVRDVSRKAGKRAELEISGEETELDRTIVEELADPLMHMVRNAVDHGIEPPLGRRAAGKPEVARISLRASHQGGNILIEVADDGRGLNREKILAKARERGLIEGERGEQLPDSEVFQLIFEPGFSTADKITDISGRGVGMDVVKKQVQKMRGRIEIHSTAGCGTAFAIKLPLTLAIIDGLVVGVGEERYIVPIFTVQETLRPAEEWISTLPSGAEMALIRGSLVPIVRLNRLFGLRSRSERIWEGLLVICEGGDKRFALVVDELAGKQEVVIKSLGKTFRNVKGIAGGAILGDGRVGLILDVDGLIGAAEHVSLG